MKRRLMLFYAYLLIGIGLAIAQTSQISGVVLSAEDGEPIVGASILVQGTTTGTITDIDGKFSVKVNKGGKLQVSYLGMYGAQNEAYMSRSAEKWVRGLCFNELGVGG